MSGKLTYVQKYKLSEARRVLDRALPDVPRSALDMMVDAGALAQCPSVKAHIHGTQPLPTEEELADEIWHTTGGRDMRIVLDTPREDTPSDEATKIAEIAKIEDPARRMAAARAAGLTY